MLRLSEDSSAMKEARDQIVDKGMSVRQAEKLTSRLKQTRRSSQRNNQKESDTIPTSFSHSLLTRVTNKLHSKVQLVQNGSRGKLEIEYYSLDDLERLIDLIAGDVN